MNNIEDYLSDDVIELIDRAAEKRHLNMLRINNLSNYNEAKLRLKETKIWAKCFRQVAHILFRDYTKELSAIPSRRDIVLLIDANKMSDYAAFYAEEANMIQATIDDYLNYLKNGNVIAAFLGKDRED